MFLFMFSGMCSRVPDVQTCVLIRGFDCGCLFALNLVSSSGPLLMEADGQHSQMGAVWLTPLMSAQISHVFTCTV